MTKKGIEYNTINGLEYVEQFDGESSWSEVQELAV